MTKDNYKLIGWNNVKESADKGEKNYELGDSLIVTQDTTLYAVWEAYKLKLKYDAMVDISSLMQQQNKQ